MNWLEIIAFVLLFVGGLNWLLVGVFKFDLVRAIFPPQQRERFDYSGLSRAVYTLVGVSAIVSLLYKFNAA
jgi:uncharacterized membrane protein YuzA (DUF378 family)